MPKLVDTTVRLLSQEPLAGALPTAEILRVAEILDKAGFACLEISGGGVFDATVRRRAETPWERIRAIKARVSTPLGIALRGRFLVGAQPVGGDIVSRFVACAAENGIEVFRLHDPLNDVSNLREAGHAITSAGGAFHAGLVYSPGRTGETDTLVEQARKLPELGATRVIVNDPTGALFPHRAKELVARIKEASGLPVGFYVQGAAGTGLAGALAAVEAGADLVSTAVYPLALTLHRVSGESLAESLEGLGHATGLETAHLWEASDVIDEYIGDEPVSPVAPRIAVRAAEYDLPPGLVAALDVHLRAHSAEDRLEEVLDEVGRVRAEAGWPPLAAPIGQILASQALLHVLEARRYGSVIDEFRALVQGGYGETPEPVDATVERAVALLAPATPVEDEPLTAEDVREQAEGLAASEEELVLIAMFGTDAEELLRKIRARHSRETALIAEDADAERAGRIRDLVKIVQESGVGEIEIEDEGMRVSVRRADEPGLPGSPLAAVATAEAVETAAEEALALDGAIRIESPDGRRLLPLVEPGGTRIRERRRHRPPGPDAVPHRGDEALQRAQVRGGGHGAGDPHRERAAGRVRAAAVRDRSRAHASSGLGRAVPMFTRVLVANRGEIAVRVIRALHELDIEAVAVYSTADADALHVSLADRAVCIGPPAAGESYLRIPSVVAAAETTGCDAVHPGYGFLAENPAFVTACEENDIVFIGPTADVMERMGDKVRAKEEMRAAGVPLVPGTDGAAGLDEVRRAAIEAGFPVLLKASAGGGGKGMRLVAGEDELESAYGAAAAEAQAAFGDGTLYLEKAISPARHVEIQVLCDAAGNVLTLGERECSIQRRHQKLVEESPSAALDPGTREEMEAAVERACRTIGYRNAGTFEFLLGPEGGFYFIEVNCRLQVEHPVSELVTGIDIVREQVRIAAGEELEVVGRAPRRGHAIEIRINAEDPSRGFAPAPGIVHRFRAPLGPGIRVDTATSDGSEIPPYYDSMIAKVIVWDETRPAAIARAQRALRELEIDGIPTTRDVALDVLGSAPFRTGSYSTSTLGELEGSVPSLQPA